MNISTPKYNKVLLGRQGEGLATKVVLDTSCVNVVPGHPVLIHQRAGDISPYPCKITEVGNTVEWIVTSADTEFPGEGRLELHWKGDNGALIKSPTYTTITLKGVSEPKEPPEVWAGYIQQIEDKLSDKMSEPENEGTPGQVLATDGNGSRYWTTAQGGSGGASFKTDETLSLKNGMLSVNRAFEVEQDNTLPITSAAVAATVGNIEVLLKTI